MGKITISSSKDYFLKDGERFFYLADTCWSAFTNASLDEWRRYLDYRKMQGFNAIQVNILPQHDRRESENYIEPYEVLPDGGWNFNVRNDRYFDRAEEMVEMAVERGFTPALVVLWCNYVRGTWGSKIAPNRIMPLELVEEYAAYVVERFSKYDPIFIISGDTNFESEEAVIYYKTAMDIVKKLAPTSLTTLHLMGGLWQIPDVLVNSYNYDFYMYQSGHSKEHQHLAYELAQKLYSMPVKWPVVNGEPCYEGHSFGGKYGRFASFDIRKAVWQSLLSGAKAGVAYGAHGVWSWHRKGKKFWGQKFSGPPFEWDVALRFPGAHDVSFAKWIFEKYDLFGLEPTNSVLVDEIDEIRVAETKDKVVVYCPYSWDISLRLDDKPFKWEGIELESRRVFRPRIEASDCYLKVGMAEYNADALIIGQA
jgi:hypothetical protein